MPKKANAPKKARIKVGCRVQLNKEPPGVTTDGVVLSSSGKKASWNVEWHHLIPYQQAVQSSKSLKLWRLNLTQVVLSSEDEKDENDGDGEDESASEEEGSPEARDVEESVKRRKFDKFAQELEGTELVVPPFFLPFSFF